MKKAIKIIFKTTMACIALALLVSAYVAISENGNIVLSYNGGEIPDEALKECAETEPQCIMVLGCAVWTDGEPSPMLKDRLDTAIALYRAGAAPKLLLTGDNSIVSYSEPDCMLRYALGQGVPPEDIFLDFAGFSTYESVYRAMDVFCVDRMIVVTQKYHMFRALRACRALGIEARGVSADQQKYSGRFYREAREVLARDKDLVKGILKLKPTFLGEEIPVDGDGTVTHLN